MPDDGSACTWTAGIALGAGLALDAAARVRAGCPGVRHQRAAGDAERTTVDRITKGVDRAQRAREAEQDRLAASRKPTPPAGKPRRGRPRA